MKNNVNLIGHVGKDPDIKVFDTGSKVARFSLATTENYKNKNGEWQKITQWHTVVGWKKQADFIEKYIKKGALIDVEGKITYRKYEDKDGSTIYATEIVINKLLPLFKIERNEQKPQTQDTQPNEQQNDDLPF